MPDFWSRAPKIRDEPQLLHALYPSNHRTPITQIVRASWTAILGLMGSVLFILIICITTNQRPVSSSRWVASAPSWIAFGGIMMKGSLGAIYGIALYQNLWLKLASFRSRKGYALKEGLTIREIEAYHNASKLSFSLIYKPLMAWSWTFGLIGLMIIVAIVPVLESGIRVVNQTEQVSRHTTLLHAQLDPRIATRAGILGTPNGSVSNILRSATMAVYDSSNIHSSTALGIVGEASFGTVEYADVECTISANAGRVLPGNQNDFFYNFTSQWITNDDRTSFNHFQSLQFNATLNNNTHFLIHTCSIKPAAGTCTAQLVGNTRTMNNITCTRQRLLTNLPNDFNSSAVGFFGITNAFVQVFKGDAKISSDASQILVNSTFVSANTRFTNGSSIILPSDLLHYVQQTLWQMPINARPLEVPTSEIGGPSDLDRTINVTVQDQEQTLILRIRYPPIVMTIIIALTTGFGAIIQLILAPNEVIGRLMQDSLIHSLTVGGKKGPAIQGACMADLEKILKRAGDEKYMYSVVIPASDTLTGHLAVEEVDRDDLPELVEPPLPGSWYG